MGRSLAPFNERVQKRQYRIKLACIGVQFKENAQHTWNRKIDARTYGGLRATFPFKTPRYIQSTSKYKLY